MNKPKMTINNLKENISNPINATNKVENISNPINATNKVENIPVIGRTEKGEFLISSVSLPNQSKKFNSYLIFEKIDENIQRPIAVVEAKDARDIVTALNFCKGTSEIQLKKMGTGTLGKIFRFINELPLELIEKFEATVVRK